MNTDISKGFGQFNAKPQNFADMINYQDGSVVSRTIIKKKAGTITLFAFDKDEALSEHSAPFDALVHIVDGEAEVSIAGQWSSVKNGEMIMLPSNIPHAVKAVSRFKMVLTMIKSEE